MALVKNSSNATGPTNELNKIEYSFDSNKRKSKKVEEPLLGTSQFSFLSNYTTSPLLLYFTHSTSFTIHISNIPVLASIKASGDGTQLGLGLDGQVDLVQVSSQQFGEISQ